MLTRQAPPPDFKWQADNIRALRTHLGLSQTALSKEIGIRQQTISEWETGMYAPRGASVTILTLLAVSSNFPFVEETEESRTGLRPLLDSPSQSAPTQFTPRRTADAGPVTQKQSSPAPRLTFEAARAAQTDRRTGTYKSVNTDGRSFGSARHGEVPM